MRRFYGPAKGARRFAPTRAQARKYGIEPPFDSEGAEAEEDADGAGGVDDDASRRD